MDLPKTYVPSSLRKKRSPREKIQYVVLGTEWTLPESVEPRRLRDFLKECLELEGVGDSVIVRLNIDGTNTLLYRWTQDRDGGPPKWVLDPRIMAVPKESKDDC